ncbi:MAG: type II toxin-antitoxin system RelE/ParE family toxin [Phyllobacteriaceae bacterium]|nr:type II toxin-antitoxin system RelE/ParE family toxin [Phyllobacteriaceae bacterium]
MRTVAYSREAEKALRRMPANVAQLIVAKINQFARDPASLANNVKALAGMSDYLRLRVSDWRVILREDGLVVAVIRIAPRGEAYR